MDKNILNDLREKLLVKEDFIPVFEYFMNKSVQEVEKEDTHDEEVKFSEFYKTFLGNAVRLSIDMVYKYSRSPIEIITLNSLILFFIKNGQLDLQITEPLSDFEKDTNDFRVAHGNIMNLAKQYIEMTGDESFENFESFYQKYIDKGIYTKEDFHTFEYHRLIIENFLWDSFHLTIQAKLPDVVVKKRGITVDLLFWKPSDEKFKLVVECDGFKWHNSKDSFINDRKRDRLLKSKGYDVIRFSGSEIYHDPVNIANDIYEYINEYPSA